jgi:hypothetical protein
MSLPSLFFWHAIDLDKLTSDIGSLHIVSLIVIISLMGAVLNQLFLLSIISNAEKGKEGSAGNGPRFERLIIRPRQSAFQGLAKASATVGGESYSTLVRILVIGSK